MYDIMSNDVRSVLVIGGGIAGIEASICLARLGFKVHLIEKTPTLGGHTMQHNTLFPTMTATTNFLKSKINEAISHPNINILTYSEVKEVGGGVGNFRIKVSKKPRYVDVQKCTACGKCAIECPVEVPNEFEVGLGKREAIYIPYPSALPPTYTIDRDHCLHFKNGTCAKCIEACPERAIKFEQKTEEIEFETSAIIIATGFDSYDATKFYEYG